MSTDVFRENCRTPGTRINDIMTLIEQGKSNYEIALAYNTTRKTINVYRKALYGGLSKGSYYMGTTAKTNQTIPIELPENVTVRTMMRITDYDAFIDILGARTGKTAVGDLAFCIGCTTRTMTSIRKDRQISVAMIIDIYERMGIDLYAEGLVVKVAEGEQ